MKRGRGPQGPTHGDAGHEWSSGQADDVAAVVGGKHPALRERDGTLYIALRVTPRAGRESLALAEDALCVRVAAAPVAGAANAAVVALLAKRLRLPKQAVTLVRGASGRQKLVAIAGMSAAEFRARMGL